MITRWPDIAVATLCCLLALAAHARRGAAEAPPLDQPHLHRRGCQRPASTCAGTAQQTDALGAAVVKLPDAPRRK
jgi:hypothetical protein